MSTAKMIDLAGASSYLTILAASFALLLLVHIVVTLRRPISKLPGPWYSKWTKVVMNYYALKGDECHYIHRLHQKYGPAVRITPTTVSFSSSTAVRTIYTTKETFLKAPWYQVFVEQDMVNLFATSSIALHRQYRRLLSNPISESSLAGEALYRVIRAKTALAVTQMRNESQRRRRWSSSSSSSSSLENTTTTTTTTTSGGVTDVYKWFLFMATDIIGTLSFGSSFRMLELGRKNQYIEDIEMAGVVGALRGMFPVVYWLATYVPLPLFRRAMQSTRRLAAYANESLARHRKQVEEAGGGGGNGYIGGGSAEKGLEEGALTTTLFSKMYKAEGGTTTTTGTTEGLTMAEVRNNAMAYIIAGSDTTANTLTYLVWEVCRRPEIKERLVRELESVASLNPSTPAATAAAEGGGGGDEKTLSSPPNLQVQDAELKALPYLNQIIDETLRLYAAAPAFLPRVVPPGGAAVDGRWWLPEGTVVGSQAFTLHRDPTVFPRPDEFEPERWAAPTREMRDMFFAFGGGSRVCLGLHLARIELRLGAALFFCAFPHAEGMSDADMDQSVHFLLSPRGKRCLIEIGN